MRHFTVEEANGLLATVRPIVERLVRHRRILARTQDELQLLRRRVAGNGSGDAARLAGLEASRSEAAAEVARAIDQLQALGAQVKDLDEGLVDFPAIHPERRETVLLCWRLGELEIEYWHGLEEGFRGRKPLPF